MRFIGEYAIPYETESKDNAAIAGLSGWMFIKEGTNGWESQVIGHATLDEVQLLQWITIHESRLTIARSLNVKFAQVIFPEKQSVLPLKRWGESLISDQRPAVVLSKHLLENFLYPAEKLKQEAANAQIYYRGNSHASLSGVWLVFESLMQIIWPERVFDFDSVQVEKKKCRHDLLLKYASKECFEEAYLINQSRQYQYNNERYEITGKHLGAHFIITNDNSIYSESIAIFGDSYAYDAGFSDLFATFFKEVHFIWSNTVDFSYVIKNKIDAVIVESAERYLIKPPIGDQLG